MTQAERPHPFPSRPRKLSSPAPKILRGQLLGNIGRRQDPFDSFSMRAPVLCLRLGTVAYHAAMAADPRSSVGAPGIAPEPAEAPASPSSAAAPAVTTNGVAGTTTSTDALARVGSICPYLRMADGTHRALGAAREHRCWAVEPPSPIPSATQLDLCLLEAHGRCERFVAAGDRRAAGLASDHIPGRLVTSPRFAIPVDPVPVVVDARVAGREPGAGAPTTQGLARRRLPAVAAGIAVLVVGGIGLAALLGGLGGQPGPTPPLAALASSASPTAGPTEPPAATPVPTPVTPAATIAGDPQPSGAAVVPQAEPTPTGVPRPTPEIARTYLVKEGDTYRKLARRFGLKPRDLRALNGRLKVGERILIPAAPWVTDAPGD